MLLGICSELRIRNLLVVQVSAHTHRTIQEHDAARRIMFAAREDGSLPQDYGNAAAAGARQETVSQLYAGDRRDCCTSPLMPISVLRLPRMASTSTIATAIMLVGMRCALFDRLGVERDGAHAFYLGAELMKAEIAWRLGKRYSQDEPLDWGCATDPPLEDRTRLKAAGHTLLAKSRH